MTQKPVAWAVTACSRMFMGEFAEFDAKAEARRCGGTCVAYALYSAPVVAQQAEQGWQPISTAPIGSTMFIVCVSVSDGIANYTTDPYAVWQPIIGRFERWPHPFEPTHWMPLPAAPKGRA